MLIPFVSGPGGLEERVGGLTHNARVVGGRSAVHHALVISPLPLEVPPMTVDTVTPRSRRALLAGSLGALAAVAAQAIGRPLPAAAGTGSVLLGEGNTASAVTSIHHANGKTGVFLASADTGAYAFGGGANGAGLYGDAADSDAPAGFGVVGHTGGLSWQIAVDADGRDGPGEGIALRARTKNGIGIAVSATGGDAMQVTGRTVFSRSGVTTFYKGQASQTVTAGRIAASTLVVATVQGAVAGVWVLGVAVNVSNQNFTIKLNKAAPKQMKVGWFVVN